MASDMGNTSLFWQNVSIFLLQDFIQHVGVEQCGVHAISRSSASPSGFSGRGRPRSEKPINYFAYKTQVQLLLRPGNC